MSTLTPRPPTPAPSEPPNPPPPPPSHSAPNFWKYLYTQNPFYVVSAVLMLFAVRSAYGRLEIGAINSWAMLGVLAGYTTVLASIAIVLVRWGRVWDDARSLLLLLVLLFLAVSISADDLFVNAASAGTAVALVVCGYVFSAALSEVVLRASRIRLGPWLRLPYHALLVLFYAAPWCLSNGIVSRDPAAQSWMLLAFPVVAAGLFLLLMPAVRRGPAYTQDNGTPYPWPWFPWTVFGVLAAVVGFRSYVLSMTFGMTGPIWGSGRTIVFDTIWGPYFLVPLVLALLLLILESGLVTRSSTLLVRLLWAAPVLVLLSLPVFGGAVHRGFLADVTRTLGAPLWWSVWGLIGFYAWSAVRRVPGAVNATLLAVSLLAFVGPDTDDLRMPALDPSPWPLLFVGVFLFVRGLRRRSSITCTAALVPLSLGLWMGLADTPLAPFRFTTTYHLVWLAIVTLGLVLRDEFSRVLRVVGAVLMVVTAILLVGTERLVDVPILGRVAYVVVLTGVCLVIARAWRVRSYLLAFFTLVAIGGYAVTVFGFREAVAIFGRSAVTAFAWSVGTLLLAFLISAHKASWLRAGRFGDPRPSPSPGTDEGPLSG